MNASQHYQRIEKAIYWMLAHYREQPDLATMAAVVHLSPTHFQKEFLAWAGVSPKQYIQFLSLNRIRQSLNEQSVLQSGLEVGLSSTSRVYDLYRRWQAMTPAQYKHGGQGLVLRYGRAAGPLGPMHLLRSEQGICKLEFAEEDSLQDALIRWKGEWPHAQWQAEDVQALVDQAFASAPAQRTPLAVHVHGSAFQLQVWQALLRLPEGALCSYRDVAAALGRPEAVRAVGTAIGKNPVAWLIPCHRVLRQTGAWGGYRWGMPKKQMILAWEAARQQSASGPNGQ